MTNRIQMNSVLPCPVIQIKELTFSGPVSLTYFGLPLFVHEKLPLVVCENQIRYGLYTYAIYV